MKRYFVVMTIYPNIECYLFELATYFKATLLMFFICPAVASEDSVVSKCSLNHERANCHSAEAAAEACLLSGMYLSSRSLIKQQLWQI